MPMPQVYTVFILLFLLISLVALVFELRAKRFASAAVSLLMVVFLSYVLMPYFRSVYAWATGPAAATAPATAPAPAPASPAGNP
jgi:hypothetical protein